MVTSPDFPIDPVADNSKFPPFLKTFLVLNLFSNEIPMSSMFDLISNPKPIAYFFFELSIIAASMNCLYFQCSYNLQMES